MAASRTVEATIPLELQRQSARIQEQLVQLNKILDVITRNLGDMSAIMGNYSPALVTQFNNLKNYLESYKGKTQNIYLDIADSLASYATALLQSLDNLTKSVNAIGQAVENL